MEERGCMLSFEANNEDTSTMENANVLFVLGGVRDLLESERVALQLSCERFRLPSISVSLGQVPELTSKCIKMLEVSAQLGWLAQGLARCAQQAPRAFTDAQDGWQEPPKPEGVLQLRRAPLHIVYELDQA